ncbi:HypC/HybG/HupF family hydrogenase formation chaperone [Aquabacterium sp.]|uniref:HypC/HybG/HupF family hydrogenase formation chaperone n=1 Tax=Aquabacterium sp. TaxID=1872578 RepID=UPI0035B17F22
MCLALPARVVTKGVNGVADDAVIDVGGVRKTVSLAMVPEAEVGDYVIVHVGYAIGRLDPDEAAQTLALFGALERHHAEQDAEQDAATLAEPDTPESAP